MTLKRHGLRARRSEEGGVTLEFVITLPLFIGVLAFIFEFGQIFLAYHDTVNNVRAASRYLSRTVDPTGAMEMANADDIIRSGRIGGTGPDWRESASVQINGAARTVAAGGSFDNPRTSARIVVVVDYPVFLLGLVNIFTPGDNPGVISFAIAEDVRIYREFG